MKRAIHDIVRATVQKRNPGITEVITRCGGRYYETIFDHVVTRDGKRERVSCKVCRRMRK